MSRRGRTIISSILPHLEDAGGRPVTSDSIAKKLKEDPGRVRDSLQNYQRVYPNGPVERVGSGIFRWREEYITPTSGAPVVVSVPTESEMAKYSIAVHNGIDGPVAANVQIGGQTHTLRNHVTQTFDVVTRKSSVLVLLDEDGEIWVAKKVQA